MVQQQSRGALILKIAGVALGVLLIGAVLAIGVSAIALPGCASCHFRGQPEFKKATLESTHGSVPCVSCHVQTNNPLGRTEFAVYEVFGMTIPLLDTSKSAVAVARDSQCLTCHADVETQIVESGGIKIAHKFCAVDQRCVSCHSEVGHGAAIKWPSVSSMNQCITCHKENKASITCDTCHVGDITKVSFTRPEFTVTHGRNWKKTHGMGDMKTCSTCHGQESCARCHGAGVPHTTTFLSDHPQYVGATDAKCTVCHRTSFCDDCHGMEMPHPERFAAQHSKIVKKSGKEQCARCHSQEDCDTCHIRHVHPGGAVGLGGPSTSATAAPGASAPATGGAQ